MQLETVHEERERPGPDNSSASAEHVREREGFRGLEFRVWGFSGSGI